MELQEGLEALGFLRAGRRRWALVHSGLRERAGGRLCRGDMGVGTEKTSSSLWGLVPRRFGVSCFTRDSHAGETLFQAFLSYK